MPKPAPSLRSLAEAKPRRRPGPKRTFRYWLESLPDDTRAEVLDLVNDRDMETWRVAEALRDGLGYELGEDPIGRWRRRELPTA